jgi:hypothetical protein
MKTQLLLKNIDVIASEIRQRIQELEQRRTLESEKETRSEILYSRAERIRKITKHHEALLDPSTGRSSTGRIYSALHLKWIYPKYHLRIQEIGSRCETTKSHVAKLIDRLKTYWHGNNLKLSGNKRAVKEVLRANCLSIDDWEKTLGYLVNFRNQLEQLSNEAQRDSDSDFNHSPDYRTVNLRGRGFTLTSQQAKVIEILHRAHAQGTPELSQDYILEEIEGGSRLIDTFKSSNMEAYKSLITPGGKRGTVRLNL